MTVQHIAGRVVSGISEATPNAPAGSSDFAAFLRSAETFKVSAHAAQRLTEHGIDVTGPTEGQITDALNKLDAKGARDAVLIRPDAAFVVNVPNRTLVTALSPSEMRDRVVTQIDSAVLL
ncbi:flagellar biosynthesis protein [Rubrivirga sp.]|uniref:flagellar biosynthesis protein n=1 Tax=Rubrivirga sp. TaxID=1885344 RepID=UPI003C795B6F